MKTGLVNHGIEPLKYSIALEELLAWQAVASDHDFGDDEEASARHAEPFFWNREMCLLLEGMAKGLRQWTLFSDDAIVPYGFMWFERPICDGIMPFYEGELAGTGYDGYRKGYQYLGWGLAPDGLNLYDGCNAPSEQLAGQGSSAMSPAMPPGSYHWAYGREVLSRRYTKVREGDHVRVLRADANGLDPGITELFATSMELLRQGFVSSPRMRADRATRRRLKMIPVEPLIRIVELRRRVHSDRTSPSDSREWACRWLVRGHWRNQPYPSLGVTRPKWIAPYVKGPEDKPLKAVRARIFAVVR